MKCDRCKKEVNDLTDSARELEYELDCADYGQTEASKREQARKVTDRHIFKRNGCQGSPSRAQYLGGKPDTLHKYDDKFAPKILKAWAICKEKEEKKASVIKTGVSTPDVMAMS
jgi:hypothetical protein